MAVAVTVRVDGIPEVEAMLKRVSPSENPKWVEGSLDDCSELTQKISAEEMIIRGSRFRGPKGPRGGKGKLRNAGVHPTKLTSRRGGAGLVGSIRVNRISAFVRDVGSDLVYARIHEVVGAGKKKTKRPFLAPGLEKAAEKFSAIFARHWAREIRK